MDINIKESYQFADCFDIHLDGVKFEKTDRNIISSAFFSLCLEYHRSVIVLVEKKLYGAAGALLRSLFESYVKGLWFYSCAKDKDFNDLKKDKFNTTFYKIVEDIEKECGNGLSKPKTENWSALNSLTHSGLLQVGRRVNGSVIQSNYDEGFIRDMLSFSNNYALLSAGELAKISNDSSAQKCVLDVAQKLNQNIS